MAVWRTQEVALPPPHRTCMPITTEVFSNCTPRLLSSVVHAAIIRHSEGRLHRAETSLVFSGATYRLLRVSMIDIGISAIRCGWRSLLPRAPGFESDDSPGLLRQAQRTACPLPRLLHQSPSPAPHILLAQDTQGHQCGISFMQSVHLRQPKLP